jgi:hypothetical protein
MRNVAPDPEIAALLRKYDEMGGVMDFVILEPMKSAFLEKVHRAAALEGMAEIDRRLREWVKSRATKELPESAFFRVRWDASKLTGERISLAGFLGTNVAPESWGQEEHSIPEVDGYQSAFFCPPHGFGGSSEEVRELFVSINRHVLGDAPEEAEIFSWSTDWSNYFEMGHEWWGAFYWTIRPVRSERIVVIGASASD